MTALAGKAIVSHYYRAPLKRSYFQGCSAGGWQALMMAQRFPWDFDGIIAGDFVTSGPANGLNWLWAYRAVTDERGDARLHQADFEFLHRAVLRRCDLNDGIEDDLIGDPRTCAFDPLEVLCKSTKNAECLTADQIEAVKKIYGGPITALGEPLYLPVAMKGSELGWTRFAARGEYLAEAMRYRYFDPDPGPTWHLEKVDFARDYRRLAIVDGLGGAANPDLRRFKAAGGKLLVYVGWNDPGTPPMAGVDYYETVERTMGGRAATQAFFRLFALPGKGHCASSSAVDWLSVLERWVEHGEVPQRLIADYTGRNKQVEFARPVHPYPTQVKYLGRGDPRDAGNFGPVEP